MGEYILEICYLIASVLYIYGLKMMSGPKPLEMVTCGLRLV